ncbi:MAG TPA: hypothetical protein VJZ91_00915 [Blastocatellia bacterium]|nr:hypothetical protein [Blastocatellia bacterium]
MKMTEDLTREALVENLNSKFLMPFPNGEALELELAEVVEHPSAPGQEQFSAFFRGPLNAPLAQGIYQLEHAQFGPFGIFLVPVGRDERGVEYEALFNRFIK